MIFRRRHRPGALTRALEFLRPRKSWRRGFAYVGRRVQRLPDTPHRIALGFACGALASFTPLFTLHIAAAVALAALLRGNLIAAALGTVIGNPLTFPAIAALALGLGAWMTGAGDEVRRFEMASVFGDLDRFLEVVFLPYLIGGLAPGLLAAAVCYWAVRPVVAAYQTRRRAKLVAAAGRRVHERLARRPLKVNPAPDPAD
jgi:uncharacterized protein (DUF2062 family)